VLVKANALELLRRELAPKRVKGYINTGSMNDAYMPLERQLGLTRRALEIIAEYRFPVHLLTKSDLILRDIDLIETIAARANTAGAAADAGSPGAVVSFTIITTADDDLARKIEPGASPLPPASKPWKPSPNAAPPAPTSAPVSCSCPFCPSSRKMSRIPAPSSRAPTTAAQRTLCPAPALPCATASACTTTPSLTTSSPACVPATSAPSATVTTPPRRTRPGWKPPSRSCGYATGVFSSRKIEKATYETVPFRFVAGGLHPDHDTLANFRKTFRAEIKDLFVQVLLLAQAAGYLQLGNISIDGSKVQANASKSKAVSY
jgi:hypothetical protein